MHAKCSGSFISCAMYKQHSQSQTLRYTSSMTTNTILMTYQLTGDLYTGPGDMPLECDNNNYY